MTQIHFEDQPLSQQSLIISREIFAALSPLDQIAAKALEKCGQVRIVDEIKDSSHR
jgi:hypothetical protein